mgnify:CR=1 FL=1
MGILDGQSQTNYYQGKNYGGYQFTSLEDIINQFIVVYVGQEKLIPKASRTDVAFHAQRAMQELSFDTFKSVKSQEITLPPSNTMILPHDYVNYTKLSWSDSAGIKHPLYPTKDTSNPFKILQEADGSYVTTLDINSVFENGDFSSPISSTPWLKSPDNGSSQGSDISVANGGPVPQNNTSQGIVNGQYEWKHVGRALSGGNLTTRHFSLWQTIDVSEIDFLSVSAKGISSAPDTGKTAGVVRLGFSTQIDITAQDPSDPNQVNGTDLRWDGYNPKHTNPTSPTVANGGKPSKNMDTTIFDVPNLETSINYIEFSDGTGVFQSLELIDVDVRNLDTVDLLVVSSGGDIGTSAALHASNTSTVGVSGTNAIDDIIISAEADLSVLQSGGESTTWSGYKSTTPNDNVDRYDDGTYDLVKGERYGVDPVRAQVNGSFYVDNLRGLINFSSNVSGKTVILDYISDSLGTDGEMQVHKFAEEAMYKWITHAILASKANVPEYQVARFKKERFAAIRQAKLRLSNLKIEELTQVLRGKSKHIKH